MYVGMYATLCVCVCQDFGVHSHLGPCLGSWWLVLKLGSPAEELGRFKGPASGRARTDRSSGILHW